MASRSKVSVCGLSLARIAGSNPTVVMGVCRECCVLSGRGLCDELITRPEESYRVWCVWVWSWSTDNDEALARWGSLAPRKKKVSLLFCLSRPCFQHKRRVMTSPISTSAIPCSKLRQKLNGVWTVSILTSYLHDVHSVIYFRVPLLVSVSEE